MNKDSNYRLVSNVQWRNLHKKLNELNDKIDNLMKTLPQKPKKYLKFHQCVPPSSICKDIMSMLSGIENYVGFIGKLSEYYGCEPMGCFINENIEKKFLAIYRPDRKAAYTREKNVDCHTVLHEFFHHLVHLDVVSIDRRSEEKLADRYADIFMERCK